jgi:hypothetical protein
MDQGFCHTVKNLLVIAMRTFYFRSNDDLDWNWIVEEEEDDDSQ